MTNEKFEMSLTVKICFAGKALPRIWPWVPSPARWCSPNMVFGGARTSHDTWVHSDLVGRGPKFRYVCPVWACQGLMECRVWEIILRSLSICLPSVGRSVCLCLSVSVSVSVSVCLSPRPIYFRALLNLDLGPSALLLVMCVYIWLYKRCLH